MAAKYYVITCSPQLLKVAIRKITSAKRGKVDLSFTIFHSYYLQVKWSNKSIILYSPRPRHSARKETLELFSLLARDSAAVNEKSMLIKRRFLKVSLHLRFVNCNWKEHRHGLVLHHVVDMVVERESEGYKTISSLSVLLRRLVCVWIIQHLVFVQIRSNSIWLSLICESTCYLEILNEKLI